MSLIAILGAFFLEQIFPLSSYTQVRMKIRGAVDYIEHALSADNAKPWQIFWFITVVGALLAGLVGLIFDQISAVLYVVYMLLILYVTLGIRQYSHFFSKIRNSLSVGDSDAARAALAQWLQEEAEVTGYRGNLVPERLSDTELMRQSLELALLSSIRYVFGGLFWFLMFSIVGLGPAGVVFYRLADFIARRWILRAQGKRDAFTIYAYKMMHWIDFLPVRCAAIVYAVVGNFEDAMHCWRTQAKKLRGLGESDASSVILTAGAGALNITLRDGLMVKNLETMDEHEFALYGNAEAPAPDGEPATLAGQIGIGQIPDARTLESAVGIFWRSMLFVLILLMMLTLSKLIG